MLGLVLVISLPILITAVPVSRKINLRDDSSLGFDSSTAETCMHLSAAAYCQDFEVDSWRCKPCERSGLKLQMKAVLYSQSYDTHGYIGFDSGSQSIVIAFRGTHDLEQWWTDFDVIPVHLNYPGASSNVEVHEGFYHSYRAVQSKVRSVVNQTLYQYPNSQVIVTGHSLGAALATLCSLDLALTFKNLPIGQYTFGQPRVGNKAFVQFYATAGVAVHYRIVHNRDPVPHVPAESTGFAHIPREVFYEEDYQGPQSLRVCDGSGEDSACSDQFWIYDITFYDHLHYMGYTLDTNACDIAKLPLDA